MRQRPLRIEGRTYFQQKYAAKQETRRYHGEHISKRQWENIFKHSLHSVVPMNPRVLAGSDGSEQAMGRGSGLDLAPPGPRAGPGLAGAAARQGEGVMRVPYMNQMWAPMERRLDMAVFRAMFASSARQARQFVTHGFVNVNGKKMKHPGYMLNPGDMFSVDPEQVLFATGKAKDYEVKEKKGKAHVERLKNPGAAAAAGGEGATADAKEEGKVEGAEEVKTEGEAKKEGEVESVATTPPASPDAAPPATTTEAAAAATPTPPAESTSPATTTPADPTTTAVDTSVPTTTSTTSTTSSSTSDDTSSDHKKPDPLNPFDPTKPYLTPWSPRDFLSPFAFIPRYLEVNFNICHAVYLRHPVARPGATEVPSPFGHETQQLAFHWFLRRR